MFALCALRPCAQRGGAADNGPLSAPQIPRAASCPRQESHPCFPREDTEQRQVEGAGAGEQVAGSACEPGTARDPLRVANARLWL